jgi:hypothetical protein
MIEIIQQALDNFSLILLGAVLFGFLIAIFDNLDK